MNPKVAALIAQLIKTGAKNPQARKLLLSILATAKKQGVSAALKKGGPALAKLAGGAALKGAAKGAGKLAPGIGAGIELVSGLGDGLDSGDVGRAGGAFAGMKGGALLGGTIGAVGGPVGVAIGTGLGGLVGGIGGSKLGGMIGDKIGIGAKYKPKNTPTESPVLPVPKPVDPGFDPAINYDIYTNGGYEDPYISDKRLKYLDGVKLAGRLRNSDEVISDEEWKDIQDNADPHQVALGILAHGAPFDKSELTFLNNLMEESGGEPYGYDVSDSHVWRDDILDGYGDHIFNYYYNYKPEAQSIDPSIDPDEKQVGPMAQDIEQVNPATVEETPEGVKTVNTKRLSLMNAGAIAQLERQVRDLKAMLEAKNGEQVA